MPGRVLATTDYIAPEQALGEPVSGRSDLYSLGIVLFEMLTGDVPFHGESAVAVAMKHVREEVPDVQRLRPGVSAATAAVVERATAKDPASSATPTPRAWRRTSSRRWRSRPRARARPRARSTSILRTLPGDARGRVPWRVRHRGLVTAAVAAVVFVVRRGGAAGGLRADPPRSRGRRLARPGAPACRRSRWPRTPPTTTTPSARGRKTGTSSATWSTTTPTRRGATEQYYSGTLQKAGGVGLGPVPRRRPAAVGAGDRGAHADARLPDAGLRRQPHQPRLPLRQLRAAERARLARPGRLDAPACVSGQRIPIALGGAAYRYYLLWLTGLPPGHQSAAISEVSLFH